MLSDAKRHGAFPQQCISEHGINYCYEIELAVSKSKLNHNRKPRPVPSYMPELSALEVIHWKLLPFYTALFGI